jgi:putative SOS response-associated peptidase YedK
MCGRTTLTITPDDLHRAFGAVVPADYRPRYNIAPSQPLLALHGSGAGRALSFFRWGLVPFWADDPGIGNRMINARGETIAGKPAFRAAFAKRRCLIVIDGFYEWRAATGGKRPYRVCRTDRGPFTVAGVWERWDGPAGVLESCAIVTTSANAMMAPIHDRMPVIIPSDRRDLWLAPDAARGELEPMLCPYPGADLEAYEVSRVVNSPANDRPECIEPLEPPLALA